MSELPNTSSTTTPLPPQQPYKNYNITTYSGATTSTTIRDYRKGNWTLEETLILITAKKLDDERRIGSTTANNRGVTGGELRWKWVENYCWSNGCLRSQNQCNDKWDNLLRDYKKVREYELRAHNSNNNLPSYWSMDKTQRKDRILPSNMLLNIYEALNEVVQKKHPHNRQQHAHLQHYQQQQPLAVLPPPPLPQPPLQPPTAPLPQVPPPAS
nr:trihelix transcription factor ASR3-like [Tanacetum cinerariifolium]